MTVIDILGHARALVRDPECWAKHALARTSDKLLLDRSELDRAASYSVPGALIRAQQLLCANDATLDRAVSFVLGRMRSRSTAPDNRMAALEHWNDTTCHGDILDTLSLATADAVDYEQRQEDEAKRVKR